MDAPHPARRRPAASVLAAVSVLAAAVTAIAVALAGTAYADPRDDKKRVDAQVARAASLLEGATERAQGAARQFAAAVAALPAAEQRVAETRGEVAAAGAIADTARRRATAAQAALATATREFDLAEARVEEARERVTTFVAASYKGSGLVALNVVISSRGPSEVMDRIGYVGQVMEHQREAVDALTVARRQAKQAQNGAGNAKRAADAAQRAADAALQTARDAQRSAEEAKARVAALAAERQAALAVAQQERSASLARYAQARAEAARVQAELRAWENRQSRSGDGGPSLRPGARLLMPVNGWKSSDFGNRFDPFFRVWQLHAGTDFAAGGGSPIRAAASGRVIRAGWNGGYGNFTCISHGRTEGRWLSTCYAHQSRILVWPGQKVRQGEVIGRVGTTGASTGDHLHFEVRLDGSPSQPLRWLPDCLC